jgi:hypothetical protein
VDDTAVGAGQGGQDATCPDIPDPPPPAPGELPATAVEFVVTPQSADSKLRRAFYTCVRGTGVDGRNQEIIVRIRGNVAGRPGYVRTAKLIIPMEIRVITRGVFGKE